MAGPPWAMMPARMSSPVISQPGPLGVFRARAARWGSSPAVRPSCSQALRTMRFRASASSSGMAARRLAWAVRETGRCGPMVAAMRPVRLEAVAGFQVSDQF